MIGHKSIHVGRAIHITFPSGGAMSLTEVEIMATLQSFTVRRSGGMLPQENLIISGLLRHILVHSEAYRETNRASCENAHYQNNHCLLSYILEPHLLRSIYTIGLLYMLYIVEGSKFEV